MNTVNFSLQRSLLFLCLLILPCSAVFSQDFNNIFKKHSELVKNDAKVALIYLKEEQKKIDPNKVEKSVNYAIFLNLILAAEVELNNDTAEVDAFLSNANAFLLKNYGEKHLEYINFLGIIGDWSKKINRRKEAIEFHLQAWNLIATLENQDIKKTFFAKKLAQTYQTAGERKKAIEFYLIALRHDRQADKLATGQNYLNLGLVYSDDGQFQKAEENYLNAQHIFENLPDEKGFLSLIYNNLALLYVDMHIYNKAENLYLKSLNLKLSIFGEKSIEYISSLNNIANFYRRNKNYAKAEFFINKNLTLRKQFYGSNHPEFFKSVANAAIFYKETKQYRVADSLYRLVTAVYDTMKNQNGFDAEIANMNYGDLLAEMGNYEKAEFFQLKVYQKWKKELGEKHPYFIYPVVYLAQIYALKGDWLKAEEKANELVNLIDFQFTQNSLFLSESELEQFARLAEFQYNVFKLIMAHNPKKATELFEKNALFKGRILNSLKNFKLYANTTKDKAVNNLFDSLKNVRQKISTAAFMNAEERQKSNLKMDDLVANAELIEKQLLAQSASFARKIAAHKPKFASLQKKLKEGEIWIEIIRYYDFAKEQTLIDSSDFQHKNYKNRTIDENAPSYIFLIASNKTASPKIVKISAEKLEKQQFNFYKNAMNFGFLDSISYPAFLGALDSVLFNPKMPVKKIYVSATGIYNLMNLNTIWHQKKQKYLGDIFDIHMVTSAKEFLEPVKTEKLSTSFNAYLFGNPTFRSDGINGVLDSAAIRRNLLKPLKGTEIEINSTISLLKKQKFTVNSFLAAEAKESKFKQIQQANVIHIATHGHFQPDFARSNNTLLRSGLFLSTEENEDGFLTAYEISNMNLENNGLVILSACETGVGMNYAQSEGAYGLQRAFKIAGAKSVMMTLWRVDDAATQKLIQYFYEEWYKLKDKHKALKAAQNKLRLTYPKPYFWGAFVIVE